MATRPYRGLRLNWAVVFADANPAAVVSLDLLDRLWRVLDAIIADRTRHSAVAIDWNGIGQNVSAGARHAQDQER
jgi:hypothetical protein